MPRLLCEATSLKSLLVTDLGKSVRSGMVKYICYVKNPEVRVLCKARYLYIYIKTLQWLYEMNPEVYL